MDSSLTKEPNEAIVTTQKETGIIETSADLNQNAKQQQPASAKQRMELQEFDNQFEDELIVSKEPIVNKQTVKQQNTSLTSNMNEQTTQKSKESTGKQLKISVSQKKNLFDTSNGPLHPLEIQLRIKQLAKCIRKRVKKSSPEHQNKSIDRSLHKLKQKVLSPINKPANHINFASINSSKLLTFQESINKTIETTEQFVRDLVRKDIMDKVWHRLQLEEKLKKNKLKLDPIKHRYPVTTFRRTILQQQKQMTLQEQSKLREREQKLLLRRKIYNSSRYDRYIKGKSRLAVNGSMVQSLTLLKQQPLIHSIDQTYNPEINQSAHSKQTLFATEIEEKEQNIEPKTHQIEANNSPQQQKPHQQQDEYAQDFL